MEQLGSHYVLFDIWVFFENSSPCSLTRIAGPLHEDLCIFIESLPEIFVEWEMFQTKFVEEIKTLTFYVELCPPPENRAFVEVMWENMVQLSGHRWCIIWRMRFSCWITKATEYIILFVFWRQQWSRERAWILRLHLPGLSCSNLLTDLMKYQYGGPVGLKLSSHQCRKYGNPER